MALLLPFMHFESVSQRKSHTKDRNCVYFSGHFIHISALEIMTKETTADFSTLPNLKEHLMIFHKQQCNASPL